MHLYAPQRTGLQKDIMMTHITKLPNVADVVELLTLARFQDSMLVISDAYNLHNCLLVPCLRPSEKSMFERYPSLKINIYEYPQTLTPEVHAYVNQLPASPVAPLSDEDVLFWARARLIQAYQQALIRRADRMTQNETRIDAPFPPMTTEEYQERVAFVVDRARAIPIEQTVDWWADVTCSVALTSPSEAALTMLVAASIDKTLVYHQINSWRQIGYIVESLVR